MKQNSWSVCYRLVGQNTCSWKKASRIDVAFDDRRNVSIKNLERDRRSIIVQDLCFISCHKRMASVFLLTWQ